MNFGMETAGAGAKIALAVALTLGPSVVTQTVEATPAVAVIAQPPCPDVQHATSDTDCMYVPSNSPPASERIVTDEGQPDNSIVDGVATAAGVSTVMGGVFLALGRRRKPTVG